MITTRMTLIMAVLIFIAGLPIISCNLILHSNNHKSTDEDSDNNGQNAETSTNIKIDQFGYTPHSSKIAVLSQAVNGFFSPDTYVPGNELEVIDTSSDAAVYTAAPYELFNGNVHEQSGDLIWHFDFSSVETPGEYYVYDEENNQRSYTFRIAENVYDTVMKQALRMFYLQRCGTPKTAGDYSDNVCHNQDEHATPIGDKDNSTLAKDLRGGWHDAGDCNKYVSFAYSTLHNLLGAYEQHPEVFTDANDIPESGNGIPDIIDEIKWELDWMIKMWQPDGSVLSKVSVEGHEAASPASLDTAPRYYGPTSYASAITVASVFAHASIVLADFPSFSTYAQNLLQKAEASWAYLETEGFPEFTDTTVNEYRNDINAGFSSANTEPDKLAFYTLGYLSSAVYLFAATDENSYNQYFIDHYSEYQDVFRWWWNQYDIIYEEAYLYYCALADGDASIQSEIQTVYESQVRTSSRLLPAYTAATDGYLAYLNDGDYVWSSNQQKSSVGLVLSDMVETGLAGTADTDTFKNAAAAYLHYLHGVNVFGLVMLTNMYDYSAENSANEMFHTWFGDGTDWDNAINDPYGPPPGYLTGGVNIYYAPSNGLENPLEGQPVQKWYKDWNTSWPEDSWEITEPAIYYQAAYVRLLSRLM